MRELVPYNNQLRRIDCALLRECVFRKITIQFCGTRHVSCALFRSNELEDMMIKAGLGLIALVGIAIATPAFAQGVSVDVPGVSIGIGERDHYRGDYYRRHRGAVVVRERDSYATARCSTKRIIRSDGTSTTIRRCN